MHSAYLAVWVSRMCYLQQLKNNRLHDIVVYCITQYVDAVRRPILRHGNIYRFLLPLCCVVVRNSMRVSRRQQEIWCHWSQCLVESLVNESADGIVIRLICPNGSFLQMSRSFKEVEFGLYVVYNLLTKDDDLNESCPSWCLWQAVALWSLCFM